MDNPDTTTAPFPGVTVVVAPDTAAGAVPACGLRPGGEVPQAHASHLLGSAASCGVFADWLVTAPPAERGGPNAIPACDLHLPAAVRFLTAVRDGELNPATGRSVELEADMAKHAPALDTDRIPGGRDVWSLTSAGEEAAPGWTPAAPPAPGRRIKVPVKMSASVNREDWAAANGLEERNVDALAADLYVYLEGQFLGDLPGMLEEADVKVVDLKPRRRTAPTAGRVTVRVSVILSFNLEVDVDAWGRINGIDPDADPAGIIKDVRAYFGGQLATDELPGVMGQAEGKLRLWALPGE